MWTGWPRIDWIDKSWFHRWRPPSRWWHTCSTKVKLKKNEEPTPMEILEFCTMAQSHPSWCLPYVSWPVHLPAHHVMPLHCICGEYSMKTLYSNHHRSARHKQFLELMGIPSMLTLWWIFGQWEWTKGYLVLVQLNHQENQRTTLHRGPVSVWAVLPWRWCTW